LAKTTVDMESELLDFANEQLICEWI
jgi:hypothetical protein